MHKVGQQEEVALVEVEDSAQESKSLDTKPVASRWHGKAVVVVALAACAALAVGLFSAPYGGISLGYGERHNVVQLSAQKPLKVAVLGAGGDVGRTIALRLKSSLRAGSILALYDINPSNLGVATDLNFIPTQVEVKGYAGHDPSPALEGADVVLIVDGLARKPGMDKADVFNVKAGICKSLAGHIAVVKPLPLIAVLTAPVNTLVPVVAEVLKGAGVYDKRKLFGISVAPMLAAALVADLKHMDPVKISVPVIGGTAGTTIVPVFSQSEVSQARVHLSEKESLALQARVRHADNEVLHDSKGQFGLALSKAEAASRFVLSLVDAFLGKKVIEQAYTARDGHVKFFFGSVHLWKNGVEMVSTPVSLNEYEKTQLHEMLPTLEADIRRGIEF